MDPIDRSRLFVHYDSLVRNRVDMLNGITEGRVRYVYRDGGCKVMMLGRVLVDYAWYDVEAAKVAAESLHCVILALWDCRREGLASFV